MATSKILVIFDNQGNESARFEIPECHIEGGKEYNWILWKFNNLHAKDPNKYDCWDTESEEIEETPHDTNLS